MRIWTALFPLAGLYRLILWAWERVYTRGWTYVERLPRPVVSVGNITVGGTGKTPLVMYLARALQEKGFRPAVLSRGYRRKGKGVGLVSDGKRVPPGVYVVRVKVDTDSEEVAAVGTVVVVY